MPPVNRVATASPYADPNTPIASAKRPRTAARTVPEAQPMQTVQEQSGNRHVVLHMPSDESPDDVLDVRPCCLDKSFAASREEGSMEGPGDENGEGQEGKWKGQSVSLFSPVLKFVGHENQQQSIGGTQAPHHPPHLAHQANHHISHQHEVETMDADGDSDEALHDLENDINSENSQKCQQVVQDASKVVKKPMQPSISMVCQEQVTMVNATSQTSLAPDNTNSLAAPELEEDEEDEMEVEGEVEVLEEFNPYLFIKQLPAYQEVAIPGKICLPQRKYTRSTSCPITLVLDLDETLVHCTVEPVPDPDVVFPVDFNGVSYQVHVRKRPYLDEFLQRVSKMFEVVVFTASQQVYADALLDIIDPMQKLVKFRLFRDACLPVEGNYIKDLNVLGRDISKTVLVDNSPYAYGYQVDNGIPIESWFEDRNDMELLKLLPFLETLAKMEDVRPLIRNTFQTYAKIQSL